MGRKAEAAFRRPRTLRRSDRGDVTHTIWTDRGYLSRANRCLRDEPETVRIRRTCLSPANYPFTCSRYCHRFRQHSKPRRNIHYSPPSQPAKLRPYWPPMHSTTACGDTTYRCRATPLIPARHAGFGTVRARGDISCEASSCWCGVSSTTSSCKRSSHPCHRRSEMSTSQRAKRPTRWEPNPGAVWRRR